MLKLFFYINLIFINNLQKSGYKLKSLKILNNIVIQKYFFKKNPLNIIETIIIRISYWVFLLKLNQSSRVVYKSIRICYLKSILNSIKLIIKTSLKLKYNSFYKKITTTLQNIYNNNVSIILDRKQYLKNILNFKGKKVIIKNNSNIINYKYIKFKNKYLFL